MNAQNIENDLGAATFRSGVAARLAGVPVETLRVWERRYGVVGPRLSSGRQRLYSSADIRRLTLIKRLVDIGHPIGVIAVLPGDALLAMLTTEKTLAESQGPAEDSAAHEMRVVLIGPLLSARWVENSADSSLRVVGRCVNVAAAAQALQNVRADIAIIEFPTLNEESVAAVNGVKDLCGANQTIVMYRFAPSAIVRRLRAAGHEVARAPSDAVEIESLCRALLRLPQSRSHIATRPAADTEPSPPRFDERALSELAAASNTVYCECPRHLVELVLSLGSFERYSAECANRGPDDAALHRDLQRTAAQAREMMEDALLRVAVAEGLPVPPSAVKGA